VRFLPAPAARASDARALLGLAQDALEGDRVAHRVLAPPAQHARGHERAVLQQPVEARRAALQPARSSSFKMQSYATRRMKKTSRFVRACSMTSRGASSMSSAVD